MMMQTGQFGRSISPGNPAIAWWEFEQNNSSQVFLDSTEYHNDLTLSHTSSSLSVSSGLENRAMYRGGNDVSFADRLIYLPRSNKNFDFGPDDSFSIGCWTKKIDVGAPTWQRAIMGRFAGTYTASGGTTGIGGFANNSYSIGCYGGTFAPHFEILDQTNSFRWTSGGLISGTQWTFLVGIIDIAAAKLRFYVNGVAQSIAILPNGGVRNGSGVNSNFIISQPMYNDSTFDTDVNTRQYNGYVDKAFVANKVLSQGEITFLYNSGAGKTFAQARAASVL